MKEAAEAYGNVVELARLLPDGTFAPEADEAAADEAEQPAED